jgi:20S proteasome subunit alpha 3
MSRRFDKRTNVFNPNGRINQIEYAIKAIKNSGPAIALHYNGGIMIATEKRASSSLLVPPKHGDKIFAIDKHIYVVVSGLTADANYLIEYIRTEGQKYRYDFGNQIPLEQLVERLCDLKQSYTQYGGMRPFGTSFIFVGWDHAKGFQVYTSDPSGNLAKWRAIAQGANEENSNNLLQEHFQEDMSRNNALELQMRVIMQTLDTAEPDINRIVLAYVEKKDPSSDELVMKFLEDAEKERLVKIVNEKYKDTK